MEELIRRELEENIQEVCITVRHSICHLVEESFF